MAPFAGFNLFVTPHGYHEASWMVSPSAEPGRLGPAQYVEMARIAERATLDALFFADVPELTPSRAWFMAETWFDPIDVLAAMATVTEHIGLLATGSTTYNAPWDLARRFATLDHLSGGRAGWNIVTTAGAGAAANFGGSVHPDHRDRYHRATEFVEVVTTLWDCWEDDAVVASRTSGEWADRAKLHQPRHVGKYFSVAGMLPIPRSPQGHPVLAQAGSSDAGVALAGRFADVVFTPQATIPAGVAFRQRVRSIAASHGRSPDAIRLWPGLSFVLGSTDDEARAAWNELEAASSEEFRLHNLTLIAGIEPSQATDVDPDGPFPYALFEAAQSTTFAAAVIAVARAGNLTFRQTAQHFATLPGGLHFTGTPLGLADLITGWLEAGAADGFTIQPLRIPADLAIFADEVIPILRRRGIAQPGYTPGTLRGKLGLARPPGRSRAT